MHLKKKLLGLLCISISGLSYVNAQTLKKTLFKFPDTGLQTGYTTTPGEDNDININPPKYVDLGGNIILDSNTLLLWQKVDGGEMSYENAKNYCDTLRLGGYTDWRLPTALEAYSTTFIQRTNPAINTTYFSNTGAEYWWTAEKQWNDSTKIWVTNSGGGIGNHSKTETISAGGTKKFHVRAVRNNWEQPLSTRFSIHGNVVFDSLTSLLWVHLPDTVSKTWEDALIYANTFSLNPYTNWRLPNIKELASLNFLENSLPSIDRTTFPGIATNQYWSSTTTPNQTDKAWYWDTKFGITTYAVKTTKKRVWLVSSNSPQASTNIVNTTMKSTKISPNPNTGNFCILNENNSFIQSNDHNPLLVIYTIHGPMIFRESVNTEKEIDVSFLPAGIYLLELRGDENQIMVKQRLVIVR